MRDAGGITAPLAVNDPGLVVPMFCFVAGVGLYAAFDHLIQAGRRRDNGTQAILTVMAFLIVGWAMVGIASYKAGDASLHAVTLKWALIFPVLCQVLFLWFVAVLTGVRPLSLLIVLTAAHAGVLALHLVSPYGLFFSDVKSLSLLRLPWGEAIVQPHATFGPSRGAVEIPTAIAAGYVLYACARRFRDGERRQALILALTASLVFAGNLHDLFVLGSTYVAPFGFLGTLLAVLLCRSHVLQRAAAPVIEVLAPSIAEAERPAPAEGRPGLARTLREMAPLGVSLVVLLLVLTARATAPGVVRETVTLVAVFGIVLATVRVLYSVGSGKRVRRTLVMGVCFCVSGQLLTLTGQIRAFDGVPLLGLDSPYNAPAIETLLLAGLLLLLNAFHFVGLEAGEMRKHLVREHRRLSEEIAERRLVEERLQQIATQEQERIRRDLHDTIGQDLTGLRCMADSLAKRLHALGLPEAARADGIGEGVRRTMGDVQAAIKGIAPVESDPGGLMVALARLVARAGDENGIRVSFECPVPVNIDDAGAATHLFRIAQEALTNALRHARARTIAVSLARQDERVVLRVTDDGAGINGHAEPGAGGVGMRTMRDRAEAIGAVLRIDALEGGGTCVACALGYGPEGRRSRERA